MILHLLTRRDILLEPATGADKSAMGAVNRPLRRSLAYTYLIHLRELTGFTARPDDCIILLAFVVIILPWRIGIPAGKANSLTPLANQPLIVYDRAGLHSHTKSANSGLRKASPTAKESK